MCRLASPGFHFFISLVFMITLRSVNCWYLGELSLSCSWETQNMFTSGFLIKESQLWGAANMLKHTLHAELKWAARGAEIWFFIQSLIIMKDFGKDDSQPRTDTDCGREERVWPEQAVVDWNCQDYSLVNSEFCTEFSGLCVETSSDLPISAGSCCFGQQSLMWMCFQSDCISCLPVHRHGGKTASLGNTQMEGTELYFSVPSSVLSHSFPLVCTSCYISFCSG